MSETRGIYIINKFKYIKLMKKIITMLCMMLMVCTAAKAQVYDENYNVIPDTTFYKVSVGYWGFDGIHNIGIASAVYNKFGKKKSFGIDMNVRSALFETYRNYNYDAGVNYIIWGGRNTKNGETTYGFYTIASAGPSLRVQEVPKVNFNENTGKVTTKKSTNLFIDAFVNLRLMFIYKKFDVSLGAFLWAPEFKFSNDYMNLGVNASIGYGF